MIKLDALLNNGQPPKEIFVTGTDTDVGKTYISVKLLEAFNQQGYSTVGIKPVASGCELLEGELINDDATQLRLASSLVVAQSILNPIRYQPPIAPHIAAQESNQSLSIELLNQRCNQALALDVDVKIIEGVGGWLVPLNHDEKMSDWVVEKKWPVILVVALKLGCLNHTLLTISALEQAKVPVLGWIANTIGPNMPYYRDNIKTLQAMIDAPCLK